MAKAVYTFYVPEEACYVETIPVDEYGELDYSSTMTQILEVPHNPAKYGAYCARCKIKFHEMEWQSDSTGYQETRRRFNLR